MANASRVVVYVDGFNLYHAIDDLRDNKLKWLNLMALSRQFLKNGEILAKCHYFTAVVDWNDQKRLRHEAYITAIKARGVTVTPGNFKKSNRHCSRTGNICPFREEKKTDVAIAVNMVADAVTDVFDRMILITADTDQIPAIETVMTLAPSKIITWAAPPGRMRQAREIGDLIKDRFEISKGLIGTCKLPRVVMDDAQQIVATRPIEYG